MFLDTMGLWHMLVGHLGLLEMARHLIVVVLG